VDLRHVIEESVLLSSPALQFRKIRVKLDLPDGCPKIYGDGGYLRQVFLNLINNSIDAMPHGGELTISLRAPAAHEPDARRPLPAAADSGMKLGATVEEVEVAIADTGTGMAHETLAHIFDPMFTTKQIGTGAGLGLAICDQIVRQHAGSIRVESEPDHGTTFKIRLPLDCREKVEGPALAAVASDGTS